MLWDVLKLALQTATVIIGLLCFADVMRMNRDDYATQLYGRRAGRGDGWFAPWLVTFVQIGLVLVAVSIVEHWIYG